jgi:hypothetical protein
MKTRSEFTTDGGGRLFTAAKLALYRIELCQELRKQGKERLAQRYEEMTLQQFADNGGYVIVKRS